MMEEAEAKENLPEWLSASTIQSAFRPPFQNPKYETLIREAYELLGHDEYSKIYNRWLREYRGF